MSEYKVRLYFSFGQVWATDNEQPDGDIRYFDTLQEANAYGRSKRPVLYEAIEQLSNKPTESES